MIIKNTTILSSSEAIKEVVSNSKRYYHKKYIFSGLLFVLGCLVVIVAALMNTPDSQVIGYLLISFGLVLWIMNSYSILTIKKKLKKQNPTLFEQGVVHDFTFKEESFLLQVKVGSSLQKIEYPYQALKKIIELDDSIYFVASSTEAYICKKEGFATEKEVELFFYGLAKHKTKVKKKLSKKSQK